MADYRLIGLNEATPDLRATTTNDTGIVDGNLTVTGVAALGANSTVASSLITTARKANALSNAISVAMTAAASGSNGIQALDNANLDMGTNDFSWFGVRMFADYTPSAAIEVERKHDGTNGWIFTILTTGILRLQINSLTYDSTVAPTITDGAFVAFGFSVIRSSASTAGSVTFYVNGVVVGASVAIVAAAPTSVDNASVYYANGGSATRTAGRWNSGILYNRALTAAEQLALYNNGPALADVGASQTPVWSSDFSGGSNGFSATSNITVAGTQLGPDGQSDWLKLTAIVNGAANSIRTGTSFPETLDGQRCRFIGQIYHTGNATVAGIQIADGQGGGGRTATILSGGGTLISPSGTQQAINCEFTGLGVSLRVRLVNASNSTSGVTAGDSVLLKGLISYKTGVVAWWDARDAQSNTGQVFDRSGNKNHAMIPAAGATIINKPVSDIRQVRWTNTWAGTQELQYIGGVNQAILPAAAYIESIIGTISGATVEDIIIGDGSDTDRYVTITTGLAAGTTSFTLANRTTDGTNLKLTVDPDANATMSIAWVINYRVLEA